MTDATIGIAETPPADWDDYLDGRSFPYRYLRARWVQFAGDVFGFPRYFLQARTAAGNLAGVLPLIQQRSLLFGSRLVSMPFFNYGGPVADDTAIRSRLVAAAAALGRERRVGTVELRDDAPLDGVSSRTDKVTLVLDLPATVAELGKQLGSKLRSQVKRADRVAPDVHIGGAELVSAFFAVFAPTMRDLGTPVYPRRFFATLLEHCGGDCRIVVISVAGQPAAAGFVVRHRDRLEIPWAASLRRFRHESINMRLYWEVLRYAIETNCPRFDFGRSTVDSGTYRFKRQWGAQPVQLYWHYPLETEGLIPRPAVGSRAIRFAQCVWAGLPTRLANRLGAVLSPGLPW